MLKQILLEKIKKEGAIPFDIFMEFCLTHNKFGYYTNKLPIGSSGDFITAPEISQLFGEMIAFYAIHIWQSLNCPSNFTILELGAGYGTLMYDFLTLAKKVPEFFKALSINIVEISPILKEIQTKKLSDFNVSWVSSINDLEVNNSCFIIANEFLDALPVKQFELINNKWYEVLVTSDISDNLVRTLNNNNFIFNNCEWIKKINTNNPKSFIINSLLNPSCINKTFNSNIVFEYSPYTFYLLNKIYNLLNKNKGSAIIIDYGYTTNNFVNTVQALKKHKYSDIFKNIGSSDITYLVNFPLIIDYLQTFSGLTLNFCNQKQFLISMGIEKRLEKLLKNATKTQKSDIISGVNRLIDDEQMGTLFKVLQITV